MHRQRLLIVVLAAVTAALLFLPIAEITCEGAWCGFVSPSARGTQVTGVPGLGTMIATVLLALLVGSRREALPTWGLGLVAVPSVSLVGLLVAGLGTDASSSTTITTSLAPLGYLLPLTALGIPGGAFALRNVPGVAAPPTSPAPESEGVQAGSARHPIPLLPHFTELLLLGVFLLFAVATGEAQSGRPNERDAVLVLIAFVSSLVSLVYALVLRRRRNKRTATGLRVHELHVVRDVSVGTAAIFLGPVIGSALQGADQMGQINRDMGSMLVFVAFLGVVVFFLVSIILGRCLRAEHSPLWGALIVLASVALLALMAWVTERMPSTGSAMGGSKAFPALADVASWLYRGSAVIGVVASALIGVSLFVEDAAARVLWRGRVVVASIAEGACLALAMVVGALGSLPEEVRDPSSAGEFVGAASVWRVLFVLGGVLLLWGQHSSAAAAQQVERLDETP